MIQIENKYELYEIKDTFQNLPVDGQMLIDLQGVRSISLYIKNELAGEGRNHIVDASYFENSSEGHMINISGDPTKLLAFAQYFLNNIPTILSSADE